MATRYHCLRPLNQARALPAILSQERLIPRNATAAANIIRLMSLKRTTRRTRLQRPLPSAAISGKKLGAIQDKPTAINLAMSMRISPALKTTVKSMPQVVKAAIVIIIALALTVEFDFRFSRKVDEEKNQVMARALHSTREGLPQEFFDFVKSLGGVQVYPRILVSSTAVGFQGSQWHGSGDWVTTMELD